MTGTDLFGSPQFRVFSGADLDLLGTFSNLGGLTFAGEVNVSIADYNDDGVPDIVATSAGAVALIETGFNGSGDPVWNPAAAPLLYPWVPNRDDTFESIVIANNIGGEPVAVTLTARREAPGIGTVDISDPSNPQAITSDFAFGDSTSIDLASGDFDGDGMTDVAVFRADDVAWFTLDWSTPGNLSATAQQTFHPFGGGLGGSVASIGPASVLSRAFTVAPDQLSTGVGDATPGASKKVDLFGDIEVNIFATDNAARGEDFDVFSLNLFAAENLILPDGVRLLPLTRALFVETDAPEGTFEGELVWSFSQEHLAAILAALGASSEDIRLARVTQTGTTDPQYTVNPLTDFEPITDTGAYATVDGFSGYALVVIPEPSSLALLGLGGLMVTRRRR